PDGVLAVKVYAADGSELINPETGVPAYFPVVDAANTPAVIVPTTGGSPGSGSGFTVTGADLDHVYFDGDSFAAGFNPGSLPPGAAGQNLKAVMVVYATRDKYDASQPVLTGMQPGQFTGVGQAWSAPATVAADGTVTVSGTINNPDNTTLAAGTLGILLYDNSGQRPLLGTQPLPVTDAAGLPALVGVHIPAGLSVTATPELPALKNLYNTEHLLTFTKAGTGSITFRPGLDIIGHRDELVRLETLNIGYDRELQEFTFSVDTAAMTFLADTEASLRLFNLGNRLNAAGLTGANYAEYLKITVKDNTGKVQNTTDFINAAAVTYDAAGDTLTIPVKHFTTFTIGANTATPPARPVDAEYREFAPAAPVTGVALGKVWRVKFNREVNTATLTPGIAI
ncbi:MAG: hypothetical protein PHC60_10370, partial [Heliobacteriaceae bacterium]|nr:hypothetical protein [Heliobacteriaceae bacterium]